MTERFSTLVQGIASALLCGFVLVEVNYPRMATSTQLAVFLWLGLVLCFTSRPLEIYLGRLPRRGLDALLIAASTVCCGWVALQSEPVFRDYWIGGVSLGNRAGMESAPDLWVGLIGLLLVLEGTRRCIGWTLPILSLIFVIYAFFGPALPDFLLPHRGYPVERIVSQTFLHSQGVFGIALRVMFVYVFLFLVFGTMLEVTGATRFVISLAARLFGKTSGGAAKIAVLSSGLMGSLSGSAVANTATTGTFTIPMMRSSRLSAHVAAGIEAAASSGGALVPPVMGAAAYMMLEVVDPPVTYLQVIRSALVPAVLYYTSLLLIVHFFCRKFQAKTTPLDSLGDSLSRAQGFLFFLGLGSLLLFLLVGYTPFRAVTLALAAIGLASLLSSTTRLSGRTFLRAVIQASNNAVTLICAAGCVGIIIGVVTLTGLGTKLPALVVPLAQNHLLTALLVLMLSSIVLGMGLPSAVCYLLMATFVGPALGQLGVVPLAAHFFIFYFGMMSMVTPPVALAAFTAATLARANMWLSSLAAFRFALVGFALPFLFVFRPQLLLLSPDGTPVGLLSALPAILQALLGILPLAASIAGYCLRPLGWALRFTFLASSLMLLLPGSTVEPWADGRLLAWTGLLVLLAALGWHWRAGTRDRDHAAAG